MPERGIYLFAVAVSDRFGQRLAIPALPLEYGEVETIAVGDIVALGCAYDGPAATEILQTEIVRQLMMHQRVVETAAQHDFVLPVRFGTVVPDTAAVRRLLEGSSALIHETWKRLVGHVEIDVAVTWDLDEVLREVALDPEVLSAKESAAGASVEQRSALMVDVGKLVAAKLDERRGEIQRVLNAALGPFVRDSQNNALVNDTLVCNTAYLVEIKDLASFDEALHSVDETLAGRYHFRRVGPLPLYSFATLHVREIGSERLRAARELLGLPEDYDEESLDQKYRSLAVALHPDTNPGDATAADRFEELARARADLATADRNRGTDTTSGPVLYFSVERSAGRSS